LDLQQKTGQIIKPGIYLMIACRGLLKLTVRF